MLLLACALNGAALAKDVAVVSPKSSSVQSITAAELLNIATGKKASTTGFTQILITDPTQPTAKLAIEKAFNMTADDFKAAAAKMPNVRVVTSDQAIMKEVAGSSTTLGLIDVYSIAASVKVLKVDGKLPLEPGYLLHKAQ